MVLLDFFLKAKFLFCFVFKGQVFVLSSANWKQRFTSTLEIYVLVIYAEDCGDWVLFFTIFLSPILLSPTGSTDEPIYEAVLQVTREGFRGSPTALIRSARGLSCFGKISRIPMHLVPVLPKRCYAVLPGLPGQVCYCTWHTRQLRKTSLMMEDKNLTSERMHVWESKNFTALLYPFMSWSSCLESAWHMVRATEVFAILMRICACMSPFVDLLAPFFFFF